MQRKTRFLRLCKCKHSNTLGNTEGKRYGAAGAKLSGVGRSRTQRNQCCLQDWFGCMERKRHWHCVCIFLAFCFDFDFLFPLRFCFFRYFLQFFSVKHEFYFSCGSLTVRVLTVMVGLQVTRSHRELASVFFSHISMWKCIWQIFCKKSRKPLQKHAKIWKRTKK